MSEPSRVLEVEGVRKSFASGSWRPGRPRKLVLHDVNLFVQQGELVGLVGENGSGKSTLLQIIVGLLARDGGDVRVAARVGYCPQQPMLWSKLTVVEHFRLYTLAYGLGDEVARRSTRRLLDELRFGAYADSRVEVLSGGTRQKLNLALALLHEPQLLVLDEPYSGFDWETYQRFWEMARARRSAGMGILVVSHLLAERERLDRLYVLEGGKAIKA